MSFITATNLVWSTPNGERVLANINFNVGKERVGLVGRNGIGKTTLLKLLTGELSPHSGSVSIVGTIGVLSQNVQTRSSDTIANLFGVRTELNVLKRAAVGEATIEELEEADWTLEDRIATSMAKVGLHMPLDTRLADLSGGQQTRARLGAVVFRQPDFLILDEPTNNLDRSGRGAVIDLVKGWHAGAIIVSHDRELLETMDAIVELTSLGATRYGGNWSHYRDCKEIESLAAEQDLASAERRVSELERKAQVAFERRERRAANGARRNARGDLPNIILGVRKNSAESSGGASVRLAERQKEHALQASIAARSKVENVQTLSVSLPSSNLASGRRVLKLTDVTAGYGLDHPIIRNCSLTIVGPERVAIVGPNGSGKTTLLQVIVGNLKPLSGTVDISVNFAALDQSIGVLDPEASIIDNFRRLNSTSTENMCRSTLARFHFRADAALQQTGTLSGGQMLRAGLACVLGGAEPPQLLVLDEPTNHLDLDSIEAIEEGLNAYDGALLVVSHDERFLSGVGIQREFRLGK
ncbi:ABC-F family ATP-binding cassette domain-containing protein [Pararhizobium qamdonense]|uniref:ABC-F family ATP-binding cassette domain-containing protein n=1 Tax=Pararhizobium qamdonense TaxID=3031126 RepID=UPI0023E30D15|nr:ABC-F family ATP-binding cassette domain-containing protein [Pararhizobium qamdonense]